MATLLTLKRRSIGRSYSSGCYSTSLPQIVMPDFGALGIPREPQLERRRICREIFTLDRWTRSKESNASNGVQFGVEMKELHSLQADHSKLKEEFAQRCEITLLLRNDFAAFLHSAVEFLLKFPDICDTLEAEHCKLKANFERCEISRLLRSDFVALFVRQHLVRQVISVHGDSLVYLLRAFGRWFEGNPRLRSPEWQVLGINFVDYSLNQGALAGHESAETPIGHESADQGAPTGPEHLEIPHPDQPEEPIEIPVDTPPPAPTVAYTEPIPEVAPSTPQVTP
ncbi:hypothetical protein CK203_038044 [Vitis vinifera]|uniref:Uncharacterized protein n=1 Tax=Vitis vinifera TaxID=29760 RepID=A0A438HNX4_VITVI|nr:hypothetical protein CK203_038044 [Vitis vinifera]